MSNNKNFKKGFTLVELLAVIVILAIILAIAVPGISGIIKSSTKNSFESDAKMIIKAIEYKELENENFNPLTITKENMQEKIGISDVNYAQINFQIVNNDVKVVIVGAGKWDGLTAYGTLKVMNVIASGDYDVVPPAITITGDNPATVVIGTAYTDAGATAIDLTDGDVTANIVKSGSVNTSALGTYSITYTVADVLGNEATAIRTVKVIKDGNAPVLATGMTPIKWNGSTWVDTTTTDDAWFNYSSTDKQWANAKTADGSMWVWIPRYIYRISSGWHSNTTGVIDIQFSIGTDDTRGGTVTLDTGTTANSSNNKWTKHPAFTFGTAELKGIWVAKFEATAAEGVANGYTSDSLCPVVGDNVTTKTVKISPSAISWRCMEITNVFIVSRNMETNSTYGWGASGSGIDTHLMKNIEWGAAAYLSKSIYGQNTNEIWINTANNYTTGCAGNTATSSSTVGCINAYNTTNGVKASTTGTIYGIYDMAGGSWERLSAYIDNSNFSLTTHGASMESANAKYKDTYTKAPVDDQANNYALTINKKGDALYETSNNINGQFSWFSDLSYLPYTSIPFLTRGGHFSSGTRAGDFNFSNTDGDVDSNSGFRPVLLVGAGL